MDLTVISTTSSLSCSSSDTRTPFPSPPRTYSNGSRIRRNLLFKLGVKAHGDVCSKGSEFPVRVYSRSILGGVRTNVAPLKGCEGEQRRKEIGSEKKQDPRPAFAFFGQRDSSQDTESTLSCSFTTSSDHSAPTASPSRSNHPLKEKKKLTFDNEVLVCLIPKRNEYSKRIKDCLWTAAEDAARDFSRNVLEFAAEGNDWRYVLEDADMYRDPVTQEMIHPIHIELWREQSGMNSEDFFDSQKTQEFYQTI